MATVGSKSLKLTNTCQASSVIIRSSPTGVTVLLTLFAAVKSFDANIAISGNFVLNVKKTNALGRGNLNQLTTLFFTK